MMITVKPVDVYDKEGNLTHIEFIDVTEDKFHFQSMWDPRDEQTAENRKTFREWSVLMAKQLGFDVLL